MGPRRASSREHVESERASLVGQRPSDRAQADDAERLTGEATKLGARLKLITPGLGFKVIEADFSSEAQNQGERVFGDPAAVGSSMAIVGCVTLLAASALTLLTARALRAGAGRGAGDPASAGQ